MGEAHGSRRRDVTNPQPDHARGLGGRPLQAKPRNRAPEPPTGRKRVTLRSIEPAELINEFFRRFDAEDIDGLLELFCDDCSFSMALYERDLVGKEELGAFFNEHISNWREHREWATSIVVEGDAGASELHFEGVLKNGAPVVMDNLNVWDFAGGKIRRIRVYADTYGFRKALGLL